MKRTIFILLLVFSLQISYAKCTGSIDLRYKQYNEVDGLDVVDQLNGVTFNSSINISEQNPERKLLTIKGMLVRETEVKNNSILFYLYDDGMLEKRIIFK